MGVQHALDEIKYNIKRGDLIKANLVMEHFPEIDREEQEAILDELFAAENGFAVQVLCFLLAKYQNYAREFPSLTGKLLAKAVKSPQTVIQGIAEKNPVKRYYIKLIGQLNLQAAVPALLDELLQNHDKIDQLAILKTLGILASPQAVETVTELLYLNDSDLLAAAVHTLGQIGTPEAIQPLAALLGKEAKIDHLVLDLFAVQQSELCLLKLNEALFSPHVQTRNYARTHLVKIGAKAIPLLIDNLFKKDIDLQIISLNILQKIGDESTASAVRKLINQKPAEANLRFAAYETLADISDRKGDYVLANGLIDPDSNVRVAASKAIDQNLDSSLVMGVVTMVERGGEEAEWIVKAIIDAQSGNLFKGLLLSSSFLKLAIAYLSGVVHQEIRGFFVQLLQQAGKEKEAAAIMEQVQRVEQKFKGRVCAVDDSKMILNIYRSIITELGYEAILFADPAQAITWLKKEKPDLLCTDLNMPEITGVELIREVRKEYSKEELPIFLVTTQDEMRDNEAAGKAGVSEIIQKPFDKEKLSAAFKKFKPSGID
jgi:CheY-like chemotaxis protein